MSTDVHSLWNKTLGTCYKAFNSLIGWFTILIFPSHTQKNAKKNTLTLHLRYIFTICKWNMISVHLHRDDPCCVNSSFAQSVKSATIKGEKWEKKRAEGGGDGWEVGVKMREGPWQITLRLHLSEMNWAFQRKDSKFYWLFTKGKHCSRSAVTICPAGWKSQNPWRVGGFMSLVVLRVGAVTCFYGTGKLCS